MDIVTNGLDRMREDGCEIDYHVIMPDHIHIILELAGKGLGLGEVISRFKARTSRAAGKRLWQPNYYEHIIRTEKALNKIREYIRDNPLALELKLDGIYRRTRPINRAATKSNSWAPCQARGDI
jgi:hypothetical protein